MTGDVDHLVETLLAEYDTLVVPGHFFGAPDHFRIGYGMDAATLEEGLRRVGAALAGK
jgi:hypothetical protein